MDDYKKQILQRAIEFYIEKAEVDEKTTKTISRLINEMKSINYKRS